MLTSVCFFIWSSVTPCASHIAFTIEQNWSESSFPKPLNKGNFTVLTILNHSGGENGTSEVGGDGGEADGGVCGCGIQGNPFHMR